MDEPPCQRWPSAFGLRPPLARLTALTGVATQLIGKDQIDYLRAISLETGDKEAIATVQTSPMLSKVGGTITVGEPSRCTISPNFIRCWNLDRGSSTTNHWSGGNQSAHQRMINRRLNDRASCLARQRPNEKETPKGKATFFYACSLKPRT